MDIKKLVKQIKKKKIATLSYTIKLLVKLDFWKNSFRVKREGAFRFKRFWGEATLRTLVYIGKNKIMAL